MRKDVMIKFRATSDQLMRLTEVCEDLGVSKSGFIRFAINDLIKRYNNGESVSEEE